MRHAIPTFRTALGLALLAGAAAAEGPPDLDMDKTCRSAGRTQVGISEEKSRDGCLRSERAARDDLKKRWSTFTPAAKAQCSKQSDAGGYPSYVETVTCLELATGVVPGRAGGDAASRPAGSGSALTAEPSPKERTNPIEVLERKP